MKTEPNEVLAYITKREWFAGLAMQGLLDSYCNQTIDDMQIRDYADLAVSTADALIEQLNKERT